MSVQMQHREKREKRKERSGGDLLLSQGQPVDAGGRFGLQEQVVQQLGRRLVRFLCFRRTKPDVSKQQC